MDYFLQFITRVLGLCGRSSSPYFSPRLQSLSERRTDFSSDLEFEVECSKSHWTGVSVSDTEDGREQVSNSDMFERLKEHTEWGPFFRRQRYNLEIGEKIAEGGQAEIFEALGTKLHDHDDFMRDSKDISRNPNEPGKRQLVVKVFKEGFPLQDLRRLWPPGLAAAALPSRYFNQYNQKYGLCWAVDAQLLMDDRFAGRFAFVFDRYWGDLRKLIDMRMLKSNGTAPFSLYSTVLILRNIAGGMSWLHKIGLLHKDLKAANVLTTLTWQNHHEYITDFESSAGIVGTGFWRAPEVLLALKNRSLEPETFTHQTDVYSYAMTCYEVITGQVPFDGHPPNDYDLVLRGERPALPDDISPELKNLVTRCWHKDPLQRPPFAEIVRHLNGLLSKTRQSSVYSAASSEERYVQFKGT